MRFATGYNVGLHRSMNAAMGPTNRVFVGAVGCAFITAVGVYPDDLNADLDARTCA